MKKEKRFSENGNKRLALLFVIVLFGILTGACQEDDSQNATSSLLDVQSADASDAGVETQSKEDNEIGCRPKCEGRECGDNGCGGSCGECPGDCGVCPKKCSGGRCFCGPMYECYFVMCGSGDGDEA